MCWLTMYHIRGWAFNNYIRGRGYVLAHNVPHKGRAFNNYIRGRGYVLAHNIQVVSGGEHLTSRPHPP